MRKLDDLPLIRRSAGIGVASFVLREGFVRVLTLASGIVLARALGPEAFGLYAIAWFVVHLFSHFGDVGLGDALTRKPVEPTEEDFRTVLTLHASLMALLVVAVYLSAPLIAALYRLDASAAWLIRAMTVPLLLASLRTVPAVRLERGLRFATLAGVDALEAILYQGVAVVLALLGGGVWSLVLGAIAGSAGATIVTYRCAPWRPRVGLSRRSLRELLPIGVPFQLQCFVNLAKDNLSPTLAGLAFGPAASGYLNWSRNVARLPVVVSDSVSRVSLPTYAKVQHDLRSLRATAQEALHWSALLSFGVLALLIALAPQIVAVVYTGKWLPALPAVYLFGVEAALATVVAVLMPLFQATGRAGTSLAFSALQAGLTWLVALALLATPLGFAGVAVAYLAGTMISAALLVRQTRTLIDLDLSCLRDPLLAGVAAGTASWLAGKALEPGPWGLVLGAATGFTVYLSFLWLIGGFHTVAQTVAGVLRREEGGL